MLLAACGGGGSPGSPDTISAEGFYAGSNLGGGLATSFELLVLEDDEFWMLRGVTSSGGFSPMGALFGQGTSSGGKFTSAAAHVLPVGSGYPATATLSAAYVPQVSIDGASVLFGTAFPFSGTAIGVPSYDYRAPARISTIQGVWQLFDFDHFSYTMTIAADGSVTGTSFGNCPFSGTVTPRPSGKNVFNVDLTSVGSASCGSGSTVSGIALSYAVDPSLREMFVAFGSNATGFGTVWFGAR